jgi:hypothetical protein
MGMTSLCRVAVDLSKGAFEVFSIHELIYYSIHKLVCYYYIHDL